MFRPLGDLVYPVDGAHGMEPRLNEPVSSSWTRYRCVHCNQTWRMEHADEFWAHLPTCQPVHPWRHAFHGGGCE
jgi:hypothetical protein